MHKYVSFCETVISPGHRVQVLYPSYAAGKTALVLELETLQDGSQTGYWLVKIEEEEIVLALLPEEMTVLAIV